MAKKRGLFITIEGIEGAGKSTAISFIQSYFESKNIELVVTREPGGTQIAEAIRFVLLDYYEESMAEDTELLLMFASRAQHITQVIKPSIASGQFVLSDRFTDASFAYQGGGRGIPEKRIAILESWVQGELRPDITLLLDVSAKIGLSRIQKRQDAPDRIEQEELDFFERVRQSYLDRSLRYADQYRTIDAGESLEEVQGSIKKVLDDVIPLLPQDENF